MPPIATQIRYKMANIEIKLHYDAATTITTKPWPPAFEQGSTKPWLPKSKQGPLSSTQLSNGDQQTLPNLQKAQIHNLFIAGLFVKPKIQHQKTCSSQILILSKSIPSI